MPTIQSSVGLVTGLQITEIVDQLMEISAKPRDRLETRTTALQKQQVAIGELMALTISIQLSSNKLGSETLFQQRTATSSDTSLLSATVTGTPAAGSYQFTPVRTAQNHQVISTGVASLDDAVGEGSLSFRFGGFADKSLDLDTLNGGAGIERGKIRITDRSGASEVVDLRFALTVDDVLEKINASDNINVLAVAEGNAIRLIDQTGLTTTNLSVREVNGGGTAASLGLADIDVAASEATGDDLVRLYDQLKLSQLNDNSGVNIRDEIADLQITFRDGSDALQIDLENDEVQTVGDLLEALNAADPTRLRADLAPDGTRLVLTDLTTDSGGTFSVASTTGGTLAEDLGLTGTASGGVITGGRLIGGLQGPLLSSLGGGHGLGTLGQISLTDRSGAVATVDLSSAETLDDVISLINDAGVEITASINSNRNGIMLRDTTGATTSNLIVGNADATNTADKLGLALNAAQQSVDSGSLHLQIVHEGTQLESLNNGSGVRLGSFMITDSAGKSSAVNLRTAKAETVGDVIDLINGLDLGVEARINDAGDGILLVDTAGGSGTMEVTESGSGHTAADLKLLGSATEVDINGTPTQVIDGSTTTTLEIDADDTLQDVVDKINELDAGVTASIFNSGGGSTPYRLAITSNASGAAGEMLLDTSQFALRFSDIVTAQDAVIQVGSADASGAGILATSSTNRFTSVLDGVQLTVNGVSDTPVTVNVASSDEKLVSAVKSLVDQYNKLQQKIADLTYFDAESETTGILMGSNETLQIESRLSRMITGRFFGLGSIQSLEQLGISTNEDGELELDELKLQDKFAEDPEAVMQFFTQEETGFVAKFNATIDSLAGEEESSLLMARNTALQRKIDVNTQRIEFYDQRLEKERERLLTYYYNLELVISKIQSNLSAIQSIAPIDMSTSSSSS